MKKKIAFVIIFVIFTVIALVFWFVNHSSVINEREFIKLAIGFRPTVTVDLAFLQAVNNGEFKKAGFDITLKPYGRADLLFAALNSKEIQGSLGVPLEPLLSIAVKGNYPYRGYMVWYFDAKNPYDGFIVPKDSPINSLEDLDGKVVGSHPSKQVTYFVSQMLPNATIQQYNPDVPFLSVKSGDQAAAYVLEPAISMAVTSGEYKLVEKGAISRHIFRGARVPAAVSLLSENWIENHPIEAAKFIQIARTIQKKEIIQPDISAHVALLTKKEYGGYSKEVASQVVEPSSSMPEDLDRKELLKFFQILRNGYLLEGDIDFDKLLYIPSANYR